MSENGRHFGHSSKLSCHPPFPSGFLRSNGFFCKSTKNMGLGSHIVHPTRSKSPTFRNKRSSSKMGGSNFYKTRSTTSPFRQFGLGMGGLDIQTGICTQNFWRDKSPHHINYKEISAAISTVKALSHPKQTTKLSVDNQVAYYYLTKGGGRKTHFNHLLRPFFNWCIKHQVTLQTEWVPTTEMKADYLSRVPYDKGDYTLNPDLFNFCLEQFCPWVNPTVDAFASPGNNKLPQFIGRYPSGEDGQIGIDSLRCPLTNFQDLYANPPWTIIHHWLHRLRENPHIRCLLIVPFWVGANWWPQLIKMRVPQTKCMVIQPFWGMLTNCLHESMPPPRWPLACLVLSGKFWRSNKSKMPLLKISWQRNPF